MFHEKHSLVKSKLSRSAQKEGGSRGHWRGRPHCGPRGWGQASQNKGGGWVSVPTTWRTERTKWKTSCILDRMEQTSHGQSQRGPELWLQATPQLDQLSQPPKLPQASGLWSFRQHNISDDIACACGPQVCWMDLERTGQDSDL